MAGVITHLVIAKEMLKLLPEGAIQNKEMFYLGALSPDAIHARVGYIRAYKKHTHFRDDIPDRDFEVPENYAIYRKRLADFISLHSDRSDECYELYLGYVVHILTDELFVLSIRKEFTDTMAELNIDQSDRDYFDFIVADMNRNDYLMVDGYDGMDEIRKAMEQVPPCAVKDYISEQEMSDCRDWMVKQHFIKKHEKLQPVYISYDRMMSFVSSSAQQIIRLLSEGVELPRML